MDSFFSL
ncbi:hypothetical protein, partial [Monkeypox virus]